jgi:hypothetical protein
MPQSTEVVKVYQIYLLTIFYIYLGAALLLVDQYGGRYLILLRWKNFVTTKGVNSFILFVVGLLLAVIKIFFPIKPGPPLLGDLFVVFGLLVSSLYNLTLFVRRKMSDKKPVKIKAEAIHKTGSLIENHKRNLGLLLVVIASLHFLFPTAILL